MNKLIVYDSTHPSATNNLCFAKDFATKGSGHSFTVELALQAQKRGLEIVTADIYLNNEYENTQAYCISDMYTSNTDRIIKKGALPFICFSMESPIIARDFYIRIANLAGKFKYNIQFFGTKERLENTPTVFSTMYFPVYDRNTLPYQIWEKRKSFILINSNKRAFYSNKDTVKEKIKNILSILKFNLQKVVDPWIRSKEIYKDRIEIIKYFSKYKDFELFGLGWDKKISGFNESYHKAAVKANRGPLEYNRKLQVMSNFRFSFCFENCSFPGYVTEKIFDCFLAGCIPIYYGAPDIDKFVPVGTFIDFRNFKSLKDLESYLNNFSENDARKMLSLTRDFLESKDFDKYVLKNIISEIINRIDLIK